MKNEFKTPGRNQPNILIILCDQLRRDASGIYGDRDAVTPHLDGLARRGVIFQQACSTYPVCVPFRFTLMTGEYAHSRFVPAIEWRMSPAERTLADEFNEAGYQTAYIGKWHLYGGHGVLPGHTSRKANLTPVPKIHQGRWEKWWGFDLANDPFHTYYFEDDDPVPRPLPGYQTDGLVDLTIDFLSRKRDHTRPFCCLLSVEPPHFPLQAPAELETQWLARDITLPPNYFHEDSHPTPSHKWDEHDREKSIEQRKIYYAMLENLDQNVGRILSCLDENGLADDTTVVFLSDHGEMGGAHRERNILKCHPYEESIGIPLIVHDPTNGNRAGVKLEDPVCSEDLYPTLLGLAGLRSAVRKPGLDLTPLIHGECDALEREAVLIEFVHDLRPNAAYHGTYWRGLRSRRYKYTVLGGAEGGIPWQFFDLQQDPFELNNLVDNPESLELVGQFHRLLRRKLVESNDHYVLAAAFGESSLNHVPPENRPVS